MRLFFENFLIVPMGPPFRFFGTMRLFKMVIFHLTLGFLNTYPPIIFFNTIRYLNVISGVKRYIRIFDVVSEVYSVSLRRRRRLENKWWHLSQPLYPNFWSVFPARKASFGWNFFVSFSLKKRHEHILKILHFLSLRISADFDRSRLVKTFWILRGRLGPFSACLRQLLRLNRVQRQTLTNEKGTLKTADWIFLQANNWVRLGHAGSIMKLENPNCFLNFHVKLWLWKSNFQKTPKYESHQSYFNTKKSILISMENVILPCSLGKSFSWASRKCRAAKTRKYEKLISNSNNLQMTKLPLLLFPTETTAVYVTEILLISGG